MDYEGTSNDLGAFIMKTKLKLKKALSTRNICAAIISLDFGKAKNRDIWHQKALKTLLITNLERSGNDLPERDKPFLQAGL